MKVTPSAISALCVLLFAASCNSEQGNNAFTRSSSMESTTDSAGAMTTPAEPATPAAADDQAIGLNEPVRKIIKTADLRCRVADVYTATTRMERLAAATGGQIADSRLENVTDDTRTLPYKPDSLKQLTSFTTTAHLTLRIPVARLDTVLGDIAAGADFINNRSLHLDDVTLRYLGNKLRNDAMAANDAALQARRLARRTRDAISSGDYTDGRNDTRIDRRIENMQLTDQVSFATLTVDLYQPRRISEMITPDTEYLMKPTIGQQASLALNGGWQLLRALLIGLLQIWPLLLMAVAGIILFRKRRRSLSKAVTRA